MWPFFFVIISGPGNLVADSFSKHMKNANRLKSKEEIESAITEYQEALKCKPQSIEAQSQLEMANELLGDRLLKKGETDQAIEAYKNSLRTQPNSIRAQSQLELAYEQSGDRLLNDGETDRAIGAYKNALQTQPNSARAHSWLGIAYERLGDHLFNNLETDRAIEAYKNALAEVPEEPYWHEHLGMALEKKGDRDAAMKEYRTATDLSPLDAGLQSKYSTLIRGPQGLGEAENRVDKIRERPTSVGGGVSPPIPIHKPDPVYSERARQAKLQGTLVLWITVDGDGNVAETSIVKPLGLGLDANALETVRTWKFQPAMHDDTPVPVRVMVQVSFKLF